MVSTGTLQLNKTEAPYASREVILDGDEVLEGLPLEGLHVAEVRHALRLRVLPCTSEWSCAVRPCLVVLL